MNHQPKPACNSGPTARQGESASEMLCTRVCVCVCVCVRCVRECVCVCYIGAEALNGRRQKRRGQRRRKQCSAKRLTRRFAPALSDVLPPSPLLARARCKERYRETERCNRALRRLAHSPTSFIKGAPSCTASSLTALAAARMAKRCVRARSQQLCLESSTLT